MSASIELDAGDVLEDRPADADSAALDRMDLAATVLDDGLRVPGTDFKFGLDPLIGVLPVAGDTVAMALSLYIVVEAVFAGVSLSTVARMLCNVAVDWVAGSVPLVGDLFDAGWKANRRNVNLAARELGTSVEGTV
ncbi:DUF4112 domain-containing protein [Halobacteriales archaeon QH_3_68_24]|nr:MAG: DUF4112 domain-containing protein [Halobacteriales archaeon QH_3_68_24]